MRRQTAVLTALLAIMVLSAALAAEAQGVRFITPQDGDTVQGLVQVRATKPNPNEGWISYKIEHDGKGEFVAAVTPPFRYEWDTRALDDEGKEVYEDGQYTLTAVALSPSGRKIGETEITVTLKNAMSASEAPRSVELKLWYERNQQVYYRAEGKWEISAQEGEENTEAVYDRAKAYNGALVAEWKNKVMSPSIAAGHALLHVVVGSAGAQYGTGEVSTFDQAGKAITYRALDEGEMVLKHPDDERFELAEMMVPLKGGMVWIGDTWRGPITLLPDPLEGTGQAAAGGMGGEMMGMPMGPGMDMGPEMGAMPPEMGMPGMPGMGDEMMPGGGAAAASRGLTDIETSSVPATHRVEGFEWVDGVPTVRIRSTFSVDDDKITIPGAAGGALGGAGETFGGGAMMEPGMGPGMMEPGMGPGMMEPAMPGMFGDEMGGAAGGMAGAAGEYDTSYKGERITWWAYTLNRPVRIQDRIVHEFELPPIQTGMGGMGESMGMMEPGMGFDPMMMPPGMEPGMMPPGMEPGMEPGMGMPGMGMPGMGMPGMGQQQVQAEPIKVRVIVSLTIREVKP